MPMITSTDGTRLYYEEAGTGTPVVFVHEFAGDYRTWEPQMRHFARSHRCVTFSARGYPPSDVPTIRRAMVRISRAATSSRSWTRWASTARTLSVIPWAPIRRCMSASATRSLHFRDGRRLRLGLGGRSGGARGDAQGRGGECQAVHGK